MKKAVVYISSAIIASVYFLACKKEPVQIRPPSTPSNNAPVAVAGQDQTITLPQNWVLLDGTKSTGNNNIVAYLWTKIAGPASATILKSTSHYTQVNDLVEGVYQFELRVTDAAGLFGKDTVQVTVNADPSLAMLWQKVLGGSRADVAQAIQPTPDGGYILVGNTNSQDGDVAGYHVGVYDCYQPCVGNVICGYLPDGLVMKLNSTGGVEWQKAVGGSAAENLLSVQPTPDGGYIASGLTYSYDGDVSGYHGGTEADAWVLKLSSSGEIQWQKVLGGSTGCDFANYILFTSDGGYIFVGHSDSEDGDVKAHAGERDVWVVRLNGNGDILWQKTMGGSRNDYAYFLQATPDNSYIVAGYTYSSNGDISGNHGDADAWVVKLNSSGTIQWQKVLGGSNEDIARSVLPAADGGYIVAGSTKSYNGDVMGANHGDADAWIVKLSSSGNFEWQKAFGGSGEDIARSVQPDRDGGYVVAGSTMSTNGDLNYNHGSQDAWLFKLSSKGEIRWTRAIGGTGSEFINSVQRASDGGFVLAGQTSSNNGDVSGNHGSVDAWIIKVK